MATIRFLSLTGSGGATGNCNLNTQFKSEILKHHQVLICLYFFQVIKRKPTLVEFTFSFNALQDIRGLSKKRAQNKHYNVFPQLLSHIECQQ